MVTIHKQFTLILMRLGPGKETVKGRKRSRQTTSDCVSGKRIVRLDEPMATMLLSTP